MSTQPGIKPKDRDTIVRALRAGVVPHSGHQHFQVGRAPEVAALVSDIERIAQGGSTVRFVIGEYGSGKTFFLLLVKAIALQKRLVTVHADLTPDRRLHSTNGLARSLYAELMRNLATRAKPEGGAMASVVERFVTNALSEAQASGTTPDAVIHGKLQQLSEMLGGYDFAEVVGAYWRGHDTGDDQLKSAAIRWLRGEYATRTDAKAALGVRTIVDDASVYDHLKLMALFVRLAGYDGLLVCLDELVNLYKITNTVGRNANYEQVLRIVNDSLQGNATGIGIVMGGTPEFLTDSRRGLYSYQALQSRLSENTFGADGIVDYSGPVIRLANLSQEDFYVLLTRLRHLWAYGDASQYPMSDAGLQAFMAHCSDRIGDAYFRTPRSTIKAFLDLLAVLEQNPQLSPEALIGDVEISQDTNPDLAPLSEDDGEETTSEDGDNGGLASFQL